MLLISTYSQVTISVVVRSIRHKDAARSINNAQGRDDGALPGAVVRAGQAADPDRALHGTRWREPVPVVPTTARDEYVFQVGTKKSPAEGDLLSPGCPHGLAA
jgi:hypothetical protein